MLRQYASQLRLEVKPSRAFLILLLSLLVLSFLSISSLQVNSLAIKVLWVLLLCIYAYCSLLRNSAKTLLWQADGSWVISARGESQAAMLSAGNVVTTLFVSMNFVLANGKKQSLFLFKDSLDAEQFRRLRVRLKVQATHLDSHDTLG